jgi:protein-tyrosine phosphatase
VRRVYDLRTGLERAEQPERDRLPPGVDYVVADVLADAPHGSPAHVRPILRDPVRANEELGNGRSLALFQAKYREFVSLPSARAAYATLFRGFADAAALPALFHCATGKDRTGWAAAALQLFLGVPEETVLEEFLASNAAMGTLIEPFIVQLESNGIARDLVEPMVFVTSAYLEIALDEVRRTYGSIEAYVADGLGLDEPTRRRLREVLVEPS